MKRAMIGVIEEVSEDAEKIAKALPLLFPSKKNVFERGVYCLCPKQIIDKGDRHIRKWIQFHERRSTDRK